MNDNILGKTKSGHVVTEKIAADIAAEFDDDLDWLETEEDEVLSRARARRMLAEQVKWLKHHEDRAQSSLDIAWREKHAEWARDCRAAILRLKAGEFGNVVPAKPVPKPRVKKTKAGSELLASIEAARAAARARKP